MAELPTGTVTFLFTDIEGSTQLERRLRELYGDVLAAHQRLLREAVAAHGGQEVDTQGDSFFFAFARARDAVAAAVDAQRALAAYDWREEGQVRVRMGLHTGEASVADGRYVGLAVHRAARISAAGHGGQILLARPTRDLVEDDLPSGQHVRDLGEARLKDLPRPEHIFQLNVEGLPSQFPSLKTVDQQELAEAAQAAIARRRSRRFVALALLAGGVAGAAALAAALVLTRGSEGVTVGPNSVAVVDPAKNEIVDAIPVGARPTAIAASKDAVWIGAVDGTVTKIDARTRETGRSFGVEATPTSLAVGRGAVWVAHGNLGALRRIDLRYGEVGEPLDVVATRHLALVVGAVAVGPAGVWAAFGDGTVAQVDAAGTRVIQSGYSANIARALAVEKRWVWAVNLDGSVSQITPTTATPLGREVSVGRGPTAIVGAHGAQWVTAFDDDAVSRLENFSATPVRVGDGPVAIAAGAEAIWVANANDGTVSRVDPERQQVVETIQIGQRPTGVAVAGGAIWVAVGSR
jgi:YVTN family beta-propeller protein